MTETTEIAEMDAHKRSFLRRPSAYAFWCHLSSGLCVTTLALSPLLFPFVIVAPFLAAIYLLFMPLLVSEAVRCGKNYSLQFPANVIPTNWKVPLTEGLRKIYRDAGFPILKRVHLTVFVPTQYFYRPRFGLLGKTTRRCNLSYDLMNMLSGEEILVLAELEARMGSKFRSFLGMGLYERYRYWNNVIDCNPQKRVISPIHGFWKWIQSYWAPVLESCVLNTFSELAESKREILVSAICRRQLTEFLQSSLWDEFIEQQDGSRELPLDEWLKMLNQPMSPATVRSIIKGWLGTPVISNSKGPTYNEAFLHIGLQADELEEILVQASLPGSFSASELLFGEHAGAVRDGLNRFAAHELRMGSSRTTRYASILTDLDAEHASKIELYSVLQNADRGRYPDLINRAQEELLRRDPNDSLSHFFKGLSLAKSKSDSAFYEFDFCYKQATLRYAAANESYLLATFLGDETRASLYLDLMNHAKNQWPQLCYDARVVGSVASMMAMDLDPRDLNYLTKLFRSCHDLKSAYSVRYFSRVDPSAFFEIIFLIPDFKFPEPQRQWDNVSRLTKSMAWPMFYIPASSASNLYEKNLSKITGAKIYERGY